MIDDWNVLCPNIIFIVGDLILGGAAEGIEKQWDICESVIDTINPSFIPLPGGHDIADEETEKIYEKRIGPTKFALEIGNSLFIALNTEGVGQLPGEFSESHLTWLKETLSQNKSKNIFIMMHQTIFNTNLYGAKWDAVADLLKDLSGSSCFCRS